MNASSAFRVHRRPPPVVSSGTYFKTPGRRFGFLLTLWGVFLRMCVLHLLLPQERLMQAIGCVRGRLRPPPDPSVISPAELANRIACFIHRLPGFRRRACYWRSLMVCEILVRHGFPVTLHVGARCEKGALDAHLWVTHLGNLLADDPRRCGRYEEITVYKKGGGHD